MVIPHTTGGHQMTIHVPTSRNIRFCTTWGKTQQAKYYIFIQLSMII